MLEDSNGRYELGFPYRAWPNWEGSLSSGVDAEKFRSLMKDVNVRWATDDDTARVIEVLGGHFPVYRSVYRFRRFDEAEGKPVRESAIVDKVFLEFEDLSCGKLCQHVMTDVTRFTNWARRNGFEPFIIASGGKSLHVYIMFDPVELQRPHETIKKVLKKLESMSRVMFADPKAMLGLAQMARMMNAKNPKTGLHAIPVRADEVSGKGIPWIQLTAKNPRPLAWRPVRSRKMMDILLETDKKAVMDATMEELFPKPVVELEPGTLCENTNKVYNAPLESDIRGHQGLLCLLSHALKSGMMQQEALEWVLDWNSKSEKPMGKGYVRYQVEWMYRTRPDYNPCRIAFTLVGMCNRCGG